MTKGEFQLIIWLIVIGLPIYAIFKIGEYVGWTALIVGIIVVAGLIIWSKVASQKKRREELMVKYEDTDLVDNLIKKTFWQGQTSEQLLDSLGHPADIDEKILKTKKKEVWKYNHISGNRYSLRITLENDVVIGWDQK